VIKLAAAGVALATILGIGYYIRHVFDERDRLATELVTARAEVITANTRLQLAVEQAKIWQDTVAQMNKAVKNIKIQSDVYIEGIENEKAPVIPAGGSIPLILPTSATVPRLSTGYADYSASRVSAITP
jgi:hypothetical protein